MMEITFVGMYADTSPACVSMTGSAVNAAIAGHLAHLRTRARAPRVDVEDVAGVGLAAGRAAEEQGHLAVGDGLLREVVVEDDGRACRCRGSTRPWSSPCRARGTAAVCNSDAVAATTMQFFIASCCSN